MTLEELKQDEQEEQQERLSLTPRSSATPATPSPTSSALIGPHGSVEPNTNVHNGNTPQIASGSRTLPSETTIGGRLPVTALQPVPRHFLGTHRASVHSRGGHYMFVDDPLRGTVRVRVGSDGVMIEETELRPFFD